MDLVPALLPARSCRISLGKPPPLSAVAAPACPSLRRFHLEYYHAENYNADNDTMRPGPDELLPLSPPVFHILLTLGDDAMHGYAIMQALERRTSGRETLLPGSLYATIARMVSDRLLEEVAAADLAGAAQSSMDRRRRYYRLTPFGRTVAQAEAARMRRLVELALEQDLLRGTT